MCDLQLMYRECGAETRDDYLRGIANENGLPIACVRKIADRLGERGADTGVARSAQLRHVRESVRPAGDRQGEK